jgi:hypothetical protein
LVKIRAPAGVKNASWFAAGVADPPGMKQIVMTGPRPGLRWARGTSTRVLQEAGALLGDSRA